MRSPSTPPAAAPRFAAALSTDAQADRAIQRAVDSLRDSLGGAGADLVCVFASHHYGAALEDLGPRLARELGAATLIGSSGEAVIGENREVEDGPGLSVWAARLPGTQVRGFTARLEVDAEGHGRFHGVPDVRDASRAGIVLFADPYSFAADEYLASLNERFPGVPVVGGMCSGGRGPGQNLMFTQDGLSSSGAVGAVIEGDVEISSVVSQGCRPVGRPWVVTACDENLMRTLASRPAVEVLYETLSALSADDQALFRNQPFIGLAIDAAKSQFTRGDFLVRGILGIEPKNKAFAVGDTLRRGQTVQFLVRDAASAGEDLSALLRERGAPTDARPGAAGALLFTCNGRGTNMFGRPDHDVGCVRATLTGELALAGFFANGEFGPVGRRNFLHGFTASLAIFRQRGER